VLHIQLSVKIFKRVDIADDRERRIRQLGTLLHEMTHAFLELYSCFCQDCRRKLKHLGPTGHGFAWQDAAFAIELAANDPSFLNLPVELGRYAALRTDLAEANEEAPRELSRWGFENRNNTFQRFGW
jgi:hypothetical protein